MRWRAATFSTPLVVGDRMNTDIAGANAAGLPSLMVLTGVNSARDAVHAIREQRATYIGHDLRSLHEDADALAVAAQPAWHIDTADTSVTVSSAADDDDGRWSSRLFAPSPTRCGRSTSTQQPSPSRPATTPPTTPCNGGP